MAHIDCSFYSDSLQKNVRVIVFVPSVNADDVLEEKKPVYYEPETRFPVLYLLHGSYGDCMDWCLRTGIERYAEEKGIAVVMPSAENSCYVSMQHGENYLEYVGKELPEFMNRMFPFSPRREDTYIAGLSMGGYGAFRVGLAYPERFGYLASLSGVMDMAEFQTGDAPHIQKMPQSYRRAVFEDPQKIRGSQDDLTELLEGRKREGKALPNLYMTVGTEDFLFDMNERFYRKLSDMGIPAVYEKWPGVHDWDFWDAHIKDVLKWLPENK